MRRRLLATLCCIAACAATSGERTAPPDVLRVGTSGDYAPFSIVGPDGMRSGLDVDLVRRFAAERGVTVRFVGFEWPALVPDLVAGRFAVAAGGITVRPERSLAGRFTVPIARSGAVVIVPAASPARRVEDLDRPGVGLGVNAGGHLERVAHERFPAATIVAVPDNAAVPDLLASGEVDALVSDSVEAPHWLARFDGARTLGPLTRDHKAWLVRADAGELAATLDEWLLAREADGTLAALRRRHLGGGEPCSTPLAALLAAADERLALMPLVAAAKRARGMPIEDRAREGVVMETAVAEVAAAAAAQGRPAPPDAAVRRFTDAQMDAAKAVQRRVLASPDSHAAQPPPDLARGLRPALERIGARISRLVVLLPGDAETRDVARVRAATAAALAGHGLEPALVQAIADALLVLAGKDPA